MASWSLGALISVSSMRSGLAVLQDDVAGTFPASAGAEADLRAALELDFVPLAGLDLLEALTADALGATIPLLGTAIGADEYNQV